LKQSKRIWNPSFSNRKQQLIFVRDGFTKRVFPFIAEFNLKTLQTKKIYTSTYTDKKEDFSIEILKGEVLVQIQSKNEFPYYFRNINKTNSHLLPISKSI
jgi:hypothetical protein